MDRITRWVLAHKRLVTAFWVTVTLAGFAFSGDAIDAMKQELSVPDREGARANALITQTYGGGGDTPPLVPVVQLPPGTSVDSPVVERDLHAAERRLERDVPGARAVSYASTGNRVFVSEDGRTTYMLVHVPADEDAFGPQSNPEAVRAARAVLREQPIAGSYARLTGLAALNEGSGDDGGGGTSVLVEALAGGLAALAVLAFVFASLLAFVPLAIAIGSIMGSFLLVWALTAIIDVSPIVAFLIALIGLGVAIDYALLVVVRWREERDRHGGDDEAIVRAMRTAGSTVVFSGTTVAIGLLALIALPLPFLRSIGYGGMLIPLVSVLSTLTLLPVILSAFGARLDWPHRRREDRASQAWTRWSQLVVRRRWPAAAAALLLLGGLLAAATTLSFGATYAHPDNLAQRGDAVTGLEQLKYSGIGSGALTPIEVVVPYSGPVPRQAASELARVNGVHGAVAPDSSDWRRDGFALVEVVPHEGASDAAGRDTLERVQDRARTLAPDLSIGGDGAQQQDFVAAVYGSFPLMIALIALVSFVLLARAFRSLLLPIKAIALNVLSVGAAWGLVALVWQHGLGSDEIWGIAATGSLPPWIPLMIFAFLFGLSMDYEVFILARMREEYDRTGSTDTAVVDGLGRTGRLVTSAALILFLAFIALSSAPPTDIKVLATGLAAGILLDATVIRALLVPATVSLFGRWNWWLPRPAARLLRVEPSVPRTAARANQAGRI